jgi:hypothetical protein
MSFLLVVCFLLAIHPERDTTHTTWGCSDIDAQPDPQIERVGRDGKPG